MSLVAYSSSEDEGSPPPVAKKPRQDAPTPKRTLRLPNMIKNIKFGAKGGAEEEAEGEAAGDERHGGRVRSFAHERGNWATYAYINVPDPSGTIASLQLAIRHLLADQQLELLPTDHLHISLTRTVVLRHHWIDLFVQSLQSSIPPCRQFAIRLRGVQIYCNDERNRTFVALAVAPRHSPAATRIVRQLDECLREFRLPAYYEDASFHVSIAWCLGDRREELLAQVGRIEQMLADAEQQRLAADEESSLEFLATRVECKIGNKLYTFSLS